MPKSSSGRNCLRENRLKHLIELIREVPDFPEPGVSFKDITPLLNDVDALSESVDLMARPFRDASVDTVLGVQSHWN